MGGLCWLEWSVGGDEGGEMWVQLVRIGNAVASCCFFDGTCREEITGFASNESLVESILLYGSETWTLTKQMT